MNCFIVRRQPSATDYRRGSIVRQARWFSAFQFLVVLTPFILEPDLCRAAVLRVDDSSLTVPAILNDEWRELKAHRTWSLADGNEIAGEPRFSRFLARDYQFRLNQNSNSMQLRTTWFAGGKCVSTSESVSGLSNARRTALEAAFGSLNDINRRLQGQSADGSTGQVVIWASFKAKPDISIPVETLSPEDLARLTPFIDLARQSFETRLFNNPDCRESGNLQSARDSVMSGGRRMNSTTAKQRVTSSRGTPRPSGTMLAGSLPRRDDSRSRNSRAGDSQSDSDQGDGQRWGFVISKYVAQPGSLVFNLAGQFTRCVRAENEAAALAAMKAVYRPVIAAGGGKRVSYTIAASESSVCQEFDDDGSTGTPYVPGNFDSPPTDDSTDAPADPDLEANGADPVAPVPDPLDVDASDGESMNAENLDDIDFLSVPVLDDIDGTDLDASTLSSEELP